MVQRGYGEGKYWICTVNKKHKFMRGYVNKPGKSNNALDHRIPGSFESNQ